MPCPLARANACARKWRARNLDFCNFYARWYGRFKSRNGQLGRKSWSPEVKAEFDQIIKSYKPNNGNT